MAYNKKDLFSVLNLFEAEEKEEEKKELDEVDAELTLEPADDAEAEELQALLGDLDLELSIEEPEGEEEKGGEAANLGGEFHYGVTKNDSDVQNLVFLKKKTHEP